MRSFSHVITTEVTVYRDSLDHVIGKVYALDMTDLRLFVAEAHDWGGDSNGAYLPLGIGTFTESAEAMNEIERRAREATA